jgi:hypothetical protein
MLSPYNKQQVERYANVVFRNLAGFFLISKPNMFFMVPGSQLTILETAIKLLIISFPAMKAHIFREKTRDTFSCQPSLEFYDHMFYHHSWYV